MKKEVFEQVYKDNVDKVQKYLYHKTRNSAVAEDLTSETFMRGFASSGPFQDRGIDPSRWIFRIAYSRLVDHYRVRQAISTERIEIVNPETTGEIAERNAMALKVREAVNQLKPEQRLAITGRYFESKRYKQIALETGRSSGSLRIAALRGLDRLKEILEDKI